jgi:hypothetical protein
MFRSRSTRDTFFPIAPIVQLPTFPILPPIVFSDNTTLGAINVGTLSSTYTTTNFVGSSDTQDYYRFNLAYGGNLNLSLTGLSADADVQILDSLGNFVASSVRGGAANETINLSGLAAGNYFVRVYQFSGDTNYTLGLSPNFANNLLATEVNAGVLGASYSNVGSISSTNTANVYQFTHSGGNFNLAMTGLSADADVQLIRDSNNNGIAEVSEIVTGSYRGGNYDETINLESLTAGNYFVQVYQYSGNTSYTLRMSNTDPSNVLATEVNVGALSGTRSFTGAVGSTDTSNLYRFSLASASNFSLSMTGLTSDADVRIIRDGNNNGLVDAGEQVAISQNWSTNAESITLSNLTAGSYLAQVYQYNGNTNYSLNMTANAIVPPVINPGGSSDQWTIMVYLDADNNLEQFGIEDFLEMSAVGSSANVNIVVQMDRISGYDSSYGNWTGTRRGLVQTGDLPTTSWGTDLGEVNMGAQSSLTDFVSWSMNTYQAQNYALVVWNHGGGLSGIAWDDSNGHDNLTLNELSGALSAGLPDTLDIFGSDACLMGMTEVAHQIRDYASIMVGSQELEPGDGWDYTAMLNSLTTTPTMNASQLGTVMVNTYGASYAGGGSGGLAVTMSAIDLVAMRTSNANNLSTALSNFASLFMSSSNSTDRTRLELHRSSAGYFEYGDYRDLGSILSAVANDTSISAAIRTAASTVLTAYNNVVISNYTDVAGRGTGLAIEFQARGSAADSSYNSSNYAFAADTQWDEFINWWATA